MGELLQGIPEAPARLLVNANGSVLLLSGPHEEYREMLQRVQELVSAGWQAMLLPTGWEVSAIGPADQWTSADMLHIACEVLEEHEAEWHDAPTDAASAGVQLACQCGGIVWSDGLRMWQERSSASCLANDVDCPVCHDLCRRGGTVRRNLSYVPKGRAVRHTPYWNEDKHEHRKPDTDGCSEDYEWTPFPGGLRPNLDAALALYIDDANLRSACVVHVAKAVEATLDAEHAKTHQDEYERLTKAAALVHDFTTNRKVAESVRAVYLDEAKRHLPFLSATPEVQP